MNQLTPCSLLWLFYIYSLFGWCIEACHSAIHSRKLVNPGFALGPLCPIYGLGGVLFAVFLPELASSPFFLFLGGLILATLLEYTTGMLLEKLFHKRLWDYSHIRYNLNGYVCVRYSVIWGLLALAAVLYVNPFLLRYLQRIPPLLSAILLGGVSALLFVDLLYTAGADLGLKPFLKKPFSLRHGRKAPTAVSAPPMADSTPVFAKGCCFYKLAALFFLGAFLGDLTETIFCLITTGRLMSRSSVVYGPFSIVWGLGCSLLTLFLYRYRHKSDRYIFVAGTLLGGAYEYVCSVFTELVFGTVFWDYSEFSFNLGGRINLLYCFFWGIAAVVWLKLIYPRLSGLIEKLPPRGGRILLNCLIIFMIFNMIISSMALARYTERNTAPSGGASSSLETFLDERFPDERMERIYPNAKLVQ